MIPERYTEKDWDLLREGEALLAEFERMQDGMKQLKSKHNGVIFGYCEAMEKTGDYEVIESEPAPVKKTRKRRTRKSTLEPSNVEVPDSGCD